MDQRDKDYAEYIEDQRATVAKEREPVEAIMEKIAETIPEVLGRVKRTIECVQPDDNPSKSHWVVAQCREILREYSQNEMRIKRYLDAKDAIAKHDREAAKMDEAISP
jgi:hypothetical protein